MKVKYSEKLAMETQKASLLSKSIKNALGGSSGASRYSQPNDPRKTPQSGYTSK